MPIYEYQCPFCQTVSECLQKISDPAPDTCPACGAQGKLTKLLSPSAFHLKGGGWYADAYSSKKPAETSAGKATTDTKSTDTSSAGSSGESKAKPAKTKAATAD